ncbi:MAG: heme exporter protein CcmD [Rhodospirillaceae bacterium]|jgi:heme exporter protein D|nr:heme exporter protein CcmD [Rhodospirillaceae bacterium]MBT4218384.1 heme exporter protein CcmD [Rhodospirillaceae bacterium]MBT4464274.1 heme exporter protein CcmD [Rhodospirillaceae bacterium]MBT5013308.1 heme exporter protein CcmD [Rhodospirillaceae bacterium]MBT5307952.1 heme exporter protein CcmD [Rhodospirillaceae bacterium]
MQDFFDMGGYGAFVWPCYAVTAAVMIGLLFLSIRKQKSVEASLAALEEKHEGAAK